MAGDIEPEHVLFILQPLNLIPIGYTGQRLMPRRACSGSVVEQSEQAMLPGRGIALRLLRPLDCLIDRSHQRRSRTETVECTGLDQRLDHTLVHHPQIDSLAEIPERSKLAVFLGECRTHLQNRVDCITAHIFHACEAEANRFLVRRKVCAA